MWKYSGAGFANNLRLRDLPQEAVPCLSTGTYAWHKDWNDGNLRLARGSFLQGIDVRLSGSKYGGQFHPGIISFARLKRQIHATTDKNPSLSPVPPNFTVLSNKCRPPISAALIYSVWNHKSQTSIKRRDACGFRFAVRVLSQGFHSERSTFVVASGPPFHWPRKQVWIKPTSFSVCVIKI